MTTKPSLIDELEHALASGTDAHLLAAHLASGLAQQAGRAIRVISTGSMSMRMTLMSASRPQRVCG